MVIGLVALALAFSAFIVVLRRSASRSPAAADPAQLTEASHADAAQATQATQATQPRTATQPLGHSVADELGRIGDRIRRPSQCC